MQMIVVKINLFYKENIDNYTYLHLYLTELSCSRLVAHCLAFFQAIPIVRIPAAAAIQEHLALTNVDVVVVAPNQLIAIANRRLELAASEILCLVTLKLAAS